MPLISNPFYKRVYSIAILFHSVLYEDLDTVNTRLVQRDIVCIKL